MNDTTVIIPTLNEERNISKIIGLIKKNYSKVRILVVDDGSEDSTKKIAKKIKSVRFIDRKKEKTKGLTASVIHAAKLVKTKNIVVIDADLQHPVEKIGEIADRLKDHDIVIGTRTRIRNWTMKRRIISKTATILGRIRLMLNGIRVADPVSGFFGVKTAFFKEVLKHHEAKFEKCGYKVLFDLLKYSRNPKISEVMYRFGQRSLGASKIGKRQIICYLKSVFK